MFCVGPLTILGSLQNGLTVRPSSSPIKSLLDGVASIAFAAALGPGVALAAMTVLVVQGTHRGWGASLLAGCARPPPRSSPSPQSGGVILLGVALRLLDIKQVRVASFLPALVLAPLLFRLADAVAAPSPGAHGGQPRVKTARTSPDGSPRGSVIGGDAYSTSGSGSGSATRPS